MAKRACVASSAFLCLTAVILVGFFLDSGNNRGEEVHVFASRPQEARNDESVNGVDKEIAVSAAQRIEEPCTPQRNIVFLKTHKTASTTTASIFDQYAYNNNLTVALPPDNRPYMDRTELFRRDMIRKSPKSAKAWKENVGFDMLSSHARYNRREMDAVVHDAKYITILRDPGSQFVSAFVFFKFEGRMRRRFDREGRTYTNVVEEFMKNPASNMRLLGDHPLLYVLHNQQFFDLGLDTEHADDWDAIDATIEKLDREIDLVMITEHYDESLILLRDLLCWSTDDILYTHKMIRNTSSAITVTPKTRQKIRRWNAADTLLYQHYNRTLWKRIAEYGPGFDDELREFRIRLHNVTREEAGSHRRLSRQMVRRMQDIGVLV